MDIYNFICEPDLDLSPIDRNEENLIIVDRENLKKLRKHIDFSVQEDMVYNDEFPVFFTSGNGYDLFSFVFLDSDRTNTDFEKISLILMEKLLVIVISGRSLHRIARGELVEEFACGTSATMYITFMELIFSDMLSGLCYYEDRLHHMEAQLITGSQEYKLEDIIRERGKCLATKKYARELLLSGDELKLNGSNLLPEKELQMLPNILAEIRLLNEMAGHLTELSAHLLEIYNSTENARTNRVLRKLNVFYFFAMPVTIISGIYGMNLFNRLGLHHAWSFFISLGITLGISYLVSLFLKKSQKL